ncbi:MAG: septum formation initiator family protein [Opitutales bacterium]
MNWHKVISGMFGALFLAVTVWAGLFFLQMHRDLEVLRAQEAANQLRLAETQARLEAQQKYLDELRHDPDVVETVIRRKLGYIRGSEFVFRFEDTRKP